MAAARRLLPRCSPRSAGRSAATGSRRSSSSARLLSAGGLAFYADRVALGMVGAKELPLARGADGALDGRAARAPRRDPEAAALPARRPASAGALGRPRNARRGGRGLARPARACSSPAELEGVLAHELAKIHNRDVTVQTPLVVLSAMVIEHEPHRRLARARAAHVPRPDRGGVPPPDAVDEARVRGRPDRRRLLRLAARPRRRADPARADGGAVSVRVDARRPSRSTRSTRSTRRASRRCSSRTRRSASACSACARSTRTGARSSAPPEPRRERRRSPRRRRARLRK